MGTDRPWLDEARAGDAYDGLKTQNYVTKLPPAAAPRSTVIVNLAPVPRWCIIMFVGGSITEVFFTLDSNGIFQPIPVYTVSDISAPFLLAPNTSLVLVSTGKVGTNTIGAIVWPDLRWQNQREKLKLLRELAALLKG